MIRQLPVSLVLPVTLFYLALRALDTIEDDMDMSKFERCLASLRRMDNDRACPATTQISHSSPDLDSLSRAPRLLTAAGPKHTVFRNMHAVTLKHRALCRFYRLMLNEHERKADDATRPPSLADAQLDTMLAQVLYTSDIGEADEHTLLVGFEQCIRVFRSCPAPQREIIADITRRMGEGMAEYILRDLGKVSALVHPNLQCTTFAPHPTRDNTTARIAVLVDTNLLSPHSTNRTRGLTPTPATCICRSDRHPRPGRLQPLLSLRCWSRR